MRYLIAAAAAAVTLAVSGVAWAGGWATVGFAPLPDGTAAGENWHPTITIKQHGVTPLGGLRPVVTIEDVVSGKVRAYPAAATSVVGRYEADVVFPSTGSWRVAVDSGFGDSRVTYGPVAIGVPGVDAGPGRRFPRGIVAAALLALAGVAGSVLVVRRGRKMTPAGR